MTVGQMIEELQKYPAQMPLACSSCDQFAYDAYEFNVTERNGYVDLTYDALPISEGDV